MSSDAIAISRLPSVAQTAWASSLVEAAVALLSSPEPGTALTRILDAAASLVPADAYAVWRHTDDEWNLVASRGLSREYTARATFHTSAGELATLPLVTGDVSADPRLQQRVHAYGSEGIAALAAMPLRLQDATLGTVTFYFRRPHQFSSEELFNAALVSKLAAAALGTAQLYEEQKKLRTEAELANKRAGFLAGAGAVISSSLQYEATLQVVADMIVPELADWCAIDILDRSGHAQRIAVAHVDPAKVAYAHEMRRRFPVDLSAVHGLGRVLRSGEAEFYPEITDQMIEEGIRDPEYLRIVRELRLRSAMIVPMVARERVIGAITLVATEAGRQFTEADLMFARSLAYRAAFAVDNARLIEEARQNERALHLALNAADAWSWEYSPLTGKLTRSRDVTGVYGRVPETLGAVAEQVFPEDRGRLQQMIAAALESDSEQELEIRIRAAADASARWLWARGRRVVDAGAVVKVVGVAADITGRKRAEEAMHVTERMATLGRLAATVTHEINNPLEAALQLLFLLRNEPLTGEGREYLASVETEIGRIAEIVRSTLGYARRPEKPELLRVQQPLLDAIRLPALKGRSRGVDVRVECDESCSVIAAAGELRQIFLNLVQNAIDATPSGGAIRVRVRRSRNWSNLSQAGVRVTIVDTGSGISPENRRRIFAEPFFSTKGDQGTGLGLWVTRTLTEKNGGAIRFRSSVRPGQSGSCFSVFLPEPAAGAAPLENHAA